MFRIQPDLRFPRFKEPWKKTVLGDISKRPMYGVGASAVEFNNKDVYVRITDIEDKSRKLMSRNFKSPSIVNEKYLLKDKDILFARTGASTGKTYIHENYEMKYDYYFAGFLIKFEILKSYYPDFVYQYTLTNFYENWIKVMSVRSGQPGINSEEYSKLKLNIPRYEEQKKIGDFFSKLDQQIELEEKKLELLEQQKRGYMQQIFWHQLIFKDKNGATYPEWKTLKIKDIAEILRGLTYKPEDIRVAGIRVLRSSNIIKDKFHTYKDDIFVDKSVVKIPLVNKGDILITAANGSPKLVGKHAIIEKLDDESVAGGFMYILRSDNSKFIQIWMSTMEYKRIISRVQGGNGSIGNLSRNDLENGYITLPCDEEQNKIGNFFNKFDELIEKQNQKIDGLKERKKGFLQKMFV